MGRLQPARRAKPTHPSFSIFTFFPPDERGPRAITREGAAMSTPIRITISNFHEIADLSDEQIREIIARVGRDDMTLALKAADERLMERVQSSISEQEWKTLTEYMEFLGPIRLSEVEAMQRSIVDKFRREFGPDEFV